MATVSVDRVETRPKEEAQESKTMRAMVRTKFGPPELLKLEEIDKPVPNNVRGVLVKIKAASVNPADRYDMIGPPLVLRIILPIFGLNMGVLRPKDQIIGSDSAGVVVAVTDKITQFKPGDEVFGSTKGSYAEYGVAREDRLVLKPANCTFDEAAALPVAAITALQGLRDKGEVKTGQKVLVNGAGGGVGHYAVQIAKALGADVTAVTNTENVGMVQRLGADKVLDYTKEDFTKTGERYDLICDIAASHGFSDYKRALTPGGTVVLVGSKKTSITSLIYFLLLRRILGRGIKFKFFIAKINQQDLSFLKELVEKGKLVSLIDRRYPLSETGQAIRYLEEGHTRGKNVITVNQS